MNHQNDENDWSFGLVLIVCVAMLLALGLIPQ